MKGGDLMIDAKIKLIEIWDIVRRLRKKLDELDKIKPVTRKQWNAIQSAQDSLLDWQGCDLGELLNLFGLPPEDRLRNFTTKGTKGHEERI